MNSVLVYLKALIPILEPIGEQGVNQLFAEVIDPAIASMSDSADLKRILVILSPAAKQIILAELQQLKG